MAQNGAIEMLVFLLDSSQESTQRQSAKALANLGVNSENKRQIASAGAIPKLIKLTRNATVAVKIEAIAALANLAVNGEPLTLLKQSSRTNESHLILSQTTTRPPLCSRVASAPSCRVLAKPPQS